MIRKKIGKPYFINLAFQDFDEYQYCVHHEVLHIAMKYDPPAWFVTIDPDPYMVELEGFGKAVVFYRCSGRDFVMELRVERELKNMGIKNAMDLFKIIN